MKKQIIACGVAVLAFFFAGCGIALAGGPWKGRIVDVETKEPLEGAVVLAVWYRVYRTPFGDNAYFYNAREVVTGKNGEFVISRYTPINLLPIISYMRGPEFTIFKPGYGSLGGLALGGYFSRGKDEVQDFELRGKRYRITMGVIELPHLTTVEERRFASPSPVGDGKDWAKQTLLIEAIRDDWQSRYGKDSGSLYRKQEE